MNKFFRKFILHKYSEQISAIAKRPVFIICEDQEIAKTIITELNNHSDIQIAASGAPFLIHIGDLAYEQYIGGNKAYYQECSKLKGDRLEEALRKISVKNTFGNNYGFSINPFDRSEAKKLKRKMDAFRWGTIIQPESKTYAGLNYLFPDMKTIYFFTKKQDSESLKYLFETGNCLCLESTVFLEAKGGTLKKVFDFLGLSFSK